MRTVPPLVAAYLADLDRRLSGADPAERADILDAIREHVDAAVDELGHEPTADEVRQILADLGPVDDVAAAWSPEDADLPARPARRSATDSRTGIVLVALGGLVLGIALVPLTVVLWVVAPLAVAAVVAGAIGWARGSAGWRTVCVLAAPVVLVAGLVGAATLAFATNVSVDAPPPSVSQRAG
ncbi:HAAS signaling domain-containing protein [Cellulomonas sp. P5_C5]